MSSYVNLLQDSEIAYRSVARDKKSVRTAILGGAGLLLLGLVYGLMQYRAVTSHADELSAAWKAGEAEFTKAKEREEALRHAAGRLAEAKGWGKSRLELSTFLEKFQAVVPPQVQITAFDLTSVLVGVEGEVRTADAQPIPAPQRRYALQLEGLMTGPESEQAVLNFELTLKNADFHDQLSLVKLRETAKVAAVPPGEGLPLGIPAGTRFTMDIQFKPRSLE